MPPGLADLHCHILPGVDDGAADMADAIAMARQAEADGIATICATPHVRHDHVVHLDELADRVSALNDELAAAGVSVVVATGAEVAETELNALGADDLKLASLGGTGAWLLVEPAPGPLSPGLVQAVQTLGSIGTSAVIAHPERHVGPGFEERLAELASEGALVQVTAAHVLDEHAGPVLVRLAQDGLVHLVASDAHSARVGRPVAIRDAIERLRGGAPAVADFAEVAPAAILRGEPVSPPAHTGGPSPAR